MKANDPRGCLHLYDADALSKAVATNPPPTWMQEARPALRLALAGDERLADAIHAETVFWHRLDACRIHLYERALRPYVSAVRKAIAHRAMPLAESHEIRMQCAERHLLTSPIAVHGFSQLVADAREVTSRRVHPDLMEWLPNGLSHFIGLS